MPENVLSIVNIFGTFFRSLYSEMRAVDSLLF